MMGFTNSSLATVRMISPNRTSNRNHAIDTITIHCTAGQGTAKEILSIFAGKSRGASCNYAVGKDGSIGLCVEEKDRSWCSSHRANDHRAITIEVSSGPRHPYAVTGAAYAALLDLVEDVCRRNGINKLVWSEKKADRTGHKNGCNMTVHRDFAAKACPGDYLYSRHGQIAAEVNRRLGAEKPKPEQEGDGRGVEDAAPYMVRVNTAGLPIRRGPGRDKPSAGLIKPGTYTIVEEAGGPGAKKWGRLKSGAGWIALDGVKKR